MSTSSLLLPTAAPGSTAWRATRTRSGSFLRARPEQAVGVRVTSVTGGRGLL